MVSKDVPSRMAPSWLRDSQIAVQRKYLECEIFRILLKHINDLVSVFFSICMSASLRSKCPEYFWKVPVLKESLKNITGKHPCRGHILINLQAFAIGHQRIMFSLGFLEIFRTVISVKWWDQQVYLQKQPPKVFYKKGVIKDITKFTGKTSAESLF